MLRCAIYARFSTDRQSASSAEDQERVCRARAEAEGWQVAGVYADIAISGATRRRPQMTRLLADVGEGRFDIVLAEAIDRVARNQADIATIYQRLQFHDVRFVTLSEGEVNELHIGLKGTMAALHLKDHADKVMRGKIGTLQRGKIPGGHKYGYDVVRRIGSNGQLERGLRTINEPQAAVVRRIFRDYLAGQSAYRIARALNEEGVSSFTGAPWRGATINGTASRGDGILRCAMYVGIFVHGRRKHRRDPETGRAVVSTTPQSARIAGEMPDLAIIDRDTWDRVQRQLDERATIPLRQRIRPRRLLSGLVRCGVCGGNFGVRTHRLIGCRNNADGGMCANSQTIRERELNERVLEGLKSELLSAEALSLMVREYHRGREQGVRAAADRRATIERRVATIDRAIERLVAAIAGGLADVPEIVKALRDHREERVDLQAELAEIAATPVIVLHPQIVEAYRARIEALVAGALPAGDALDAESYEIRSLIRSVTVTPVSKGVNEIVVDSSLDSVVRLATNQPRKTEGVTPGLVRLAQVQH
ncbi:recombinase family protein [Sphingomonas sp.]|uniref:recombinase family protein n=1 Tax=Sphingomonas sp. TaxID=28214 RepID=UPI000DB62B5F|nr:recombinase family protein [Sphingomonas sp.]PZU10032.1 MAG: recombinase [Sphingomonas sp.]